MDDWIALRDKALYFLPQAVRFKNDFEVSNNEISKIAHEIGVNISNIVVGQAVRLEPITYKKAESIYKVINHIAKTRFSKEMEPYKIIASVFFLEKNNLRGNKRAETIENYRSQGLSEAAINMVSSGFRVPLSVAIKALKADNEIPYLNAKNMNQYIGTRASYNIKTAYRLKGEAPFLLSDLREAPPIGHPWVINEHHQHAS